MSQWMFALLSPPLFLKIFRRMNGEEGRGRGRGGRGRGTGLVHWRRWVTMSKYAPRLLFLPLPPLGAPPPSPPSVNIGYCKEILRRSDCCLASLFREAVFSLLLCLLFVGCLHFIYRYSVSYLQHTHAIYLSVRLPICLSVCLCTCIRFLCVYQD